MTAMVLTWPRARRLLARWGSLLLAAGASALVLVSSHAPGPGVAAAAEAASGRGHVPASPRSVPPPRAALNALLDAFVPQVLERRNLAGGRSLVTSDNRGARGDWLRGAIPFQAYAARGTRFHGWTVNYSYPGDVGFDIFIPATRADAVSIAFRGEAKREAGRWRIAVFYPQATFQPAGKTQTVVADTDFQPQAASPSTTKGRLSAAWLAVPALVAALVVLTGIAVGAIRWSRSRARVRAIERELAQLR